ncbi:hypothetical protein MLD38_009955 [Melastoma candidum]|uniref:Uncharacterized protein n=1 Tax=Melastoma candidum TaxID=119954 RepID=A0ACB9R2C9_9MYRT|nr:hypothetical protein MLD38_009955 [Melastoma candidum]
MQGQFHLNLEQLQAVPEVDTGLLQQVLSLTAEPVEHIATRTEAAGVTAAAKASAGSSDDSRLMGVHPLGSTRGEWLLLQLLF